jgi:hypothetical protein
MKTAPWLVGTALLKYPKIVVADKRHCLLSANNGLNYFGNNHAACISTIFARIFASISALNSGLSLINSFTASLPCPSLLVS